jgi:hypothetical protein
MSFLQIIFYKMFFLLKIFCKHRNMLIEHCFKWMGLINYGFWWWLSGKMNGIISARTNNAIWFAVLLFKNYFNVLKFN